MGFGIPVDDTLDVPTGTTPTGAWKLSDGCTKYLLEYEITVIGATPTITVTVEGTNLVDQSEGSFKVLGTSTETALGLYQVEITTFPYAAVRLNVSANTNVTARVRLTGTKGG